MASSPNPRRERRPRPKQARRDGPLHRGHTPSGPRLIVSIATMICGQVPARPGSMASPQLCTPKNDANDALHLIEPLRVQVAGHLDVLMVLPGDLEGEARGREPYEPQPEVARIGVVIVGLDVADASVTVLELPLNDKIGVFVARSKSSLLGSSLSNETAKYSPPDSSTDTYLA